MDRRIIAVAALAAVLAAALQLAVLWGPGWHTGSQPQAPSEPNSSLPAGTNASASGLAAENTSASPPEAATASAVNSSSAQPPVNSSAAGAGAPVNSSTAGQAGGPVNSSPSVEQAGGNESGVNATQSLRSRVESWAIQLQDTDPREIASSGFSLVVFDYSRDGSDEGAYTRAEIEAVKRAGVIPVAYLSIGEAEDYRFYWHESWRASPPPWLGPENPEWEGNYAVRYWDKRWKAIVFRYLDKIIEQGFSGVYLDKVDEYEYWADHGVNETWAARQMIRFILEIARYAREKAGPGFIIIPQNGEGLLDYDNGSLLAAVSGWASEDVFYDGLKPSPWTGEKVPRLDRVVKAGKPVLVVDYVDDGSRSHADLARILDFREKALAHGYVPYAALVDRELDELNIIPGIQPPKEG